MAVTLLLCLEQCGTSQANLALLLVTRDTLQHSRCCSRLSSILYVSLRYRYTHLNIEVCLWVSTCVLHVYTYSIVG